MMHACTICGSNAAYALSLRRERGKWIVKPICGKCRNGLLQEARAAKKTIVIYSLEASLREVEKRNEAALKFRPFLDVFAKAKKTSVDKCAAKTVCNNGKKPALAIAR